MRAVPLAALGAALVACSGTQQTLPDGGSLEGPVTFRIYFKTAQARPLYVQTQNGARWISVLDSRGEALEVPGACGCDCEGCSCPACDEALARVVQVPHLGNTAWTWNGLETPKAGKCGSADCRSRRSAPAGKYTARFCYGYSFTDDASGGQSLEAPECTEVPFVYPADAGVVLLEVCDC